MGLSKWYKSSCVTGNSKEFLTKHQNSKYKVAKYSWTYKEVIFFRMTANAKNKYFRIRYLPYLYKKLAQTEIKDHYDVMNRPEQIQVKSSSFKIIVGEYPFKIQALSNVYRC